MKVAIIGANGQLGTDLGAVFSIDHEVVELNHSAIEITDIDSVRNVLCAVKPQILLNTAAYNLVPDAEKHPVTAFQINSIGPLNLAKLCQELKIRFVHYSTDYVFDGKKKTPYTENDTPNPLSVYASTKLTGEQFALNYCDDSTVIRVSGIYGKVPSRSKGANFVSTMVRLAKEKPEVRVVDDEILTPTPTYHIAKETLGLIAADKSGLFHMSCEGFCSWFEFAQTIWEVLNLRTPLLRASVQDFPLLVKRPFYSVLSNEKRNNLGVNDMPGWKDGLVEFLEKSFAI